MFDLITSDAPALPPLFADARLQSLFTQRLDIATRQLQSPRFARLQYRSEIDAVTTALDSLYQTTPILYHDLTATLQGLQTSLDSATASIKQQDDLISTATDLINASQEAYTLAAIRLDHTQAESIEAENEAHEGQIKKATKRKQAYEDACNRITRYIEIVDGMVATLDRLDANRVADQARADYLPHLQAFGREFAAYREVMAKNGRLPPAQQDKADATELLTILGLTRYL